MIQIYPLAAKGDLRDSVMCSNGHTIGCMKHVATEMEDWLKKTIDLDQEVSVILQFVNYHLHTEDTHIQPRPEMYIGFIGPRGGEVWSMRILFDVKAGTEIVSMSEIKPRMRNYFHSIAQLIDNANDIEELAKAYNDTKE